MFEAVAGVDAEPGTAADLRGGAAAAEPLPQRRWSADDQGLELVDRLGTGIHHTAAGGQQDPQRLTVTTGARLGQLLPGQHFPCRSGRVQHIALGAVASGRPLGPVHLDHPLAVVGQQAGQPGTEAARALHRPHSAAWRLTLRQAQQLPVPGGGGRHRGLGQHRPGRAADRGGVGVAVGVDPDDELDLAF